MHDCCLYTARGPGVTRGVNCGQCDGGLHNNAVGIVGGENDPAGCGPAGRLGAVGFRVPHMYNAERGDRDFGPGGGGGLLAGAVHHVGEAARFVAPKANLPWF